jgi:hypothetical protein
MDRGAELQRMSLLVRDDRNGSCRSTRRNVPRLGRDEDRDEIDVLGKLAEHFSTEPFVTDLVMDVLDGEDCDLAVDALRRFLDKIQIFRRRKP